MSSICLWITFFGCLLKVSDSYLTANEKDTFVPENHENWDNLDHRTCGFSFHERIIGGRSVGLGKYPWVVRVGRSIGEGSSSLVFPCGGVILNRFYVLTAGHCFLDQNALPTTVRAGEFNILSSRACVRGVCPPPVQDITIGQYFTPRHFQADSIENDIALLLLSKPIELSETVLPICLPPFSISSANMTNKVAEVAGWGLINIYTRRTPSMLNAVRLKIVDNLWCEMYKEKHFVFPFNILCAGDESGKDSCAGDSGGPLMLPVAMQGSVKYYVIGIVSYGPEACGETNSPGIYTYVPQFESWLLNLITKK